MVEQHFCLRWNNYRTNITAEFETLREGEHFVDVTLACDGRQLKAHKVVLSACSPYFKELLQCNPCTHPIIILRDVAYSHMRSLLEFMYAGEVNVSQAHLGSFLSTAEALKIRGLAESSDERRESKPNCLSPLSALKNTLGPLGGMPFSGLGPPFLERPLIPSLMQHHSSEPPPNPPTSHHQGAGLPLLGAALPLSLSASASPYGQPPLSSALSCGNQRKQMSPERSPGLNLLNDPPIGPLALTTNASSLDYRSRIKSDDGDRKDPLSPLSLPPSKRLRLDRKFGPTPSREYFDDQTQNGGRHTPNISSGGGSDTMLDNAVKTNANITANVSSSGGDGNDSRNVTPKMEPTDRPASDTEGSMQGWTEEEGSGSRGAGEGGPGSEVFSSPNEAPGSLNVSSAGTPLDSENTSHLLQVLSSEHHPGDSGMPSFSTAPPGLGPSPSREVPRSCPYCGKLISNFYNLKKHIMTMHQAPAFYHACCHCTATFRTPEYLRKHLVNVHKYPVKKKK